MQRLSLLTGGVVDREQRQPPPRQPTEAELAIAAVRGVEARLDQILTKNATERAEALSREMVEQEKAARAKVEADLSETRNAMERERAEREAALSSVRAELDASRNETLLSIAERERERQTHDSIVAQQREQLETSAAAVAEMAARVASSR